MPLNIHEITPKNQEKIEAVVLERTGFEFGRLLGSGGQGYVYEAVDHPGTILKLTLSPNEAIFARVILDTTLNLLPGIATVKDAFNISVPGFHTVSVICRERITTCEELEIDPVVVQYSELTESYLQYPVDESFEDRFHEINAVVKNFAIEAIDEKKYFDTMFRIFANLEYDERFIENYPDYFAGESPLPLKWVAEFLKVAAEEFGLFITDVYGQNLGIREYDEGDKEANAYHLVLFDFGMGTHTGEPTSEILKLAGIRLEEISL
jgi:hypothetical protein